MIILSTSILRCLFIEYYEKMDYKYTKTQMKGKLHSDSTDFTPVLAKIKNYQNLGLILSGISKGFYCQTFCSENHSRFYNAIFITADNQQY